jgi:hypothetical protein
MPPMAKGEKKMGVVAFPEVRRVKKGRKKKLK